MESSRVASAVGRFPTALSNLAIAVRELLRRVKIRKCERSLRVCETLSLGERRLLMVVQFERRRFLIGATNQSISLLERLDERGHTSAGAHEFSRDNPSWRGPH